MERRLTMTSLRAIAVKLWGNGFSRTIMRKGLKDLIGADDKCSQAVARALTDVIHKMISSEETSVLGHIEHSREEAVLSDRMVKFKSLTTQHQGGDGESVPLMHFARIGKTGDWALLLFKIIRYLAPENCLELGTCLGFSAAYQASALKLNGRGRLITLEGQPSLAEVAKDHLSMLGLKNVEVVTGLFRDTIESTLSRIKPIDYAFIDGHHEETATIEYFEKIYPFLGKDAVLVFDDISWSAGMKRAWEKISRDGRVCRSLSLFVIGICVIKKDQ